eukprot:TRINITY_DN3152_c0_g1_i8.p1 TRINITY_DN3152_c0_g1~~TRINITY_DN3152_c0_g1_i8.p1  ORF type:complete len:101 (+),score=13.87 TRINITY_DN3152_c0_g1_i8:77-379(+)
MKAFGPFIKNKKRLVSKQKTLLRKKTIQYKTEKLFQNIAFLFIHKDTIHSKLNNPNAFLHKHAFMFLSFPFSLIFQFSHTHGREAILDVYCDALWVALIR